jgi:hypothetical protein
MEKGRNLQAVKEAQGSPNAARLIVRGRPSARELVSM